MAKVNKCAHLLAYITGLVNQELLLQNEYLAAENRILRSHLPPRLRLSDPERETLAEIGKGLGRRALAEVARVAKPDTILRWYRKLIAEKFDGSKHRSYPGRPRISPEVEALIVKLARENGSWGYDRSAGALKNLDHEVSDQTVGMFCAVTGLSLRPNAVRAPVGVSSSGRTWKCSPGWTSSPSRCSPGAGWPRTMFYSSSILKVGESPSPA